MESSEWVAKFHKLAAAQHALGRAIKPVVRGRQGSRGRVPFGSAFVVVHDGVFAAITAAHVVEDGPEPRYVGMAERGSLRWPERYVRMVSKEVDATDPDTAYTIFAVGPGAEPGGDDAFPLESVVTGVQPQPGMAFLAAGHPVSKGKLRRSTGTLKAGLAFVVGEAVPLTEYAKYGLDTRVHLAMQYSPKDVLLSDGSPGTGPDPAGMSGGVLLLGALDRSGTLQLRPAGVLTAFRPGPPSILVASRMESVLDYLAPRRPPALREFAPAL